LIGKASGFTTYIEAGAGLGQLATVLSMHGLRAIGVECDSNRFVAMRDLFAELPEAKNATAVKGMFPDAAKDLLTPSSVVIFTGFVNGLVKTEEDRILKSIAAVGGRH
jgi:hypothetical protein